MIALSMLSDDQKELIEYSYFRGFTLAELAEHFQLPIATAAVKLRSALRILRQKLKQLL
jgi:RNA polymerase sigma-70 factor (ECF subfamily)